MRHDEIVAKIGELSETTRSLKSQLEQPKSRLDRFKEYAGVVSLVLSLATGCFAIYSSFVTEPEKSRADAQSKLHDSLAQIVTLDQEYLKELQQGDPSINNGTLTSKRNILLQQAEDLADQRGVASAEDQLNLGNACIFGSHYESALKHFQAAVQVAGKDSLTKANAEMQIGNLNFRGVGGSIQEGRSSFDDAERVLGKPTSGPAARMLVQVLASRSYQECSLGDTALGEQARQRALDEITLLARDPTTNPQFIDMSKVGLTTGLGNTHCAANAPANTSLPTFAPMAPTGTASPGLATVNKIALSNRMMTLLVARDYRGFEQNMTATAQAQLPESSLQSTWEQVQAVTGSYKRTIDTKTKMVNNTTFYIVHAECQKRLLNLALAFDPANRVTGVWLLPLSPLSKQEIERRGKKAATDFFEQKFADLYSGFDQNFRNQASVAQMQTYFSQITSTSGDFDHVVKASKDQDLDIVDVVCQLQGGKVVLRVFYDPDMTISNFIVLPKQ